MYRQGIFGLQSLILQGVSFLRQMTFLNLHTFALQKNNFFPVNTGEWAYFNISKRCKFAKNLDSPFSRCNFALASLLKHAPFWRTRIPKEFRYHSEGTQNPFWSHSLTQKNLLSWQKLLPSTSSRASQVNLATLSRKSTSPQTSATTASTRLNRLPPSRRMCWIGIKCTIRFIGFWAPTS